MEIEKKLQNIIHKKESEKKRKVRTLVTMTMVLFIGITIGALLMQNINFSNFSITGFVASGSLPTVGGSTDNWGNILNDYLLQEHTSTGAHGNVTAENLTVEGDVNITGNLTVGDKITFAFGEVIDNLVDGFITITGGLNVSGVVNSTGLNIDGTIKADNYTDSNDRQIGNLVLIETQTASNDATIDFDLPSGYDTFKVMITNLRPAITDTELQLRLSNDSGLTFRDGSTDYVFAMRGLDAGGSSRDLNANGVSALQPAGINTANLGLAGGAVFSEYSHSSEITISNALISKVTMVEWKSVYTQDGGLFATQTGGGRLRVDTEVNDAIRFLMSSGNIESGKFSLYGVKS